MAKFNNKKLQNIRNFQSLWHSRPEYIGKLLKEDQYIREYITGSMKAKGWKLSEIIIKRKVKQIHIAFQIHNKIIKERKRWTKNRLKNRMKFNISSNKTLGQPKGLLSSQLKIKRLKKLCVKNNKKYLYFQLFLMVNELRKMYPHNNISFYIQKTKPLQFNAHLVNSWIITNLKKKSSHKRVLNRIIWKYRRGVEKTKSYIPYGVLLGSFTAKSNVHGTSLYSNSLYNFLSKNTNKEDKKIFLSWITGNLIYLYNVHKLNASQSHYDGLLSHDHDPFNMTSHKEQHSMSSLSHNNHVLNFQQHNNYNSFWLKWKTIYYKLNKKYNKRKGKYVKNNKHSSTRRINKSHIIAGPKAFRRNYSYSGFNTYVKPFNPLHYNQISQYVRWETKNKDNTHILNNIIPLSKWDILSLSHNTLSHDLKNNNNDIYQDIRSSWKLARKCITLNSINLPESGKLPKIQKRLGNIRRRFWEQLKNEYIDDTLSLLNYYKLNYLLNAPYNKSYDEYFLWQGKNFIKFLQYHPPLLDHLIKCLLAVPMVDSYQQNDLLSSMNIEHDLSYEGMSQHIAFLTMVWAGFFDYIYHFENSLSKWQGIRILLSGRVGFRKMGRAKKYSRYWGVSKNSSAVLPLQYSYSQIHTRYGIIGMKVFIR